MVEQIKIAITRNDGGVTILSFVTNDGHGLVREPTPANIDAEIAKAQLDCVSWRVVRDSDIPANRYFRNAWKDDGAIKEDIPKSIEIHKANLRNQRAELFLKLDADYMRADEEGNQQEKNRIKAEKQRLRDITSHPVLVNATTTEEILSVKL